MSCGTIDRGSSANCEDLPKGGTRPRIVVINMDDIDGDFEEDADGRITGITLVDGAFAYEFTGFRNDAKTSEEIIKPDTGIPMFKHMLGWVIYERTQLQKNNIENLARGRFVVIMENKGKDDDSVIVLGAGVGVAAVPQVIRDAYANGGFYTVSFSTPDDEGELEPKLPQSLGTNYEDAISIIAGLLPAS